MHFTSLVASTALLLASIGIASPTLASEGFKAELKARMLKDVASKSAATNLARQNFGRWSCPTGKVAGCCGPQYIGASGDKPCGFGNGLATPTPPGNTGFYDQCNNDYGIAVPACCNDITYESTVFAYGYADVATGHGCTDPPAAAPNQKYTCETSKKALCCQRDGINLANPVGCLGPKTPSTTTVIGGRNLYFPCAASKTARCCTSATGNTSNPNGNMGGTGCVDSGSPSTFNE